jgi:hypothetical protein
MSTEPGATQLINTPLTPEQAGARRAELMADPEFQSRVAARDAVAFDEHTKLWRVEHGLTPEPQPPATADEVRARMTERDLAIDDARVMTYAKFIDGWNDEKRATIARDLATQEQHDEAVREVDRMKRDKVFAARVLAGDSAAVDAWIRFGKIASMKIAPPGHMW